ncbi:MAG: hypothetical protein OEN22_03445 [Gammaproteobacteria bacterium]|nr:hypothetical protein [Gammaproteobacteria bacterium]
MKKNLAALFIVDIHDITVDAMGNTIQWTRMLPCLAHVRGVS